MNDSEVSFVYIASVLALVTKVNELWSSHREEFLPQVARSLGPHNFHETRKCLINFHCARRDYVTTGVENKARTYSRISCGAPSK